jgi:hypothetical protein
MIYTEFAPSIKKITLSNETDTMENIKNVELQIKILHSKITNIEESQKLILEKLNIIYEQTRINEIIQNTIDSTLIEIQKQILCSDTNIKEVDKAIKEEIADPVDERSIFKCVQKITNVEEKKQQKKRGRKKKDQAQFKENTIVEEEEKLIVEEEKLIVEEEEKLIAEEEKLIAEEEKLIAEEEKLITEEEKEEIEEEEKEEIEDEPVIEIEKKIEDGPVIEKIINEAGEINDNDFDDDDFI